MARSVRKIRGDSFIPPLEFVVRKVVEHVVEPVVPNLMVAQ
jgi:hypothetical protein